VARVKDILLDTGDIFPEMEFTSIEGKTVVFPKDYIKGWSILLFYRGHW